MNTWVLWA